MFNVVTIFMPDLHASAIRLFSLIQGEVSGRFDSGDVERVITSDGKLLSSSNAYCRRCGHCCEAGCPSLEMSSGEARCSLHPNGEDEYPCDKMPAPLGGRKRCNPAKYTMPRECYTFGPHVICGKILRSEDIGDLNAAAQSRRDCPGAAAMAEDYRFVFL
jgi:hypothetical protein